MSYFQYFIEDITNIPLPSKFTFPFYYEPHPLCEIAVSELQNYLQNQTDFIHNFGLDDNDTTMPIGKMFGVLIVENPQKELGYLWAVSGKLGNTNNHKRFVPPVYDMLVKDSIFLQEEEVLNSINKEIEALEQSTEYKEITEKLITTQELAEADISSKREEAQKAKGLRDKKRAEAKATLSQEEFNAIQTELNQESLTAKQFLNSVARYYEHILLPIKQVKQAIEDRIEELKTLRKSKSSELQSYLFSQYKFLNIEKHSKNLIEIFKEESGGSIPAGAGECSAPKLLQYAFIHNLKPIAMAEFWWGKSPKGEVRKHKNYYPSCQGKCKPILSHMLKGIEMDKDPLLTNPAIGKELEIIYEDNHLIVVNKPENFLSVDGINIKDSAYTRLKQKHKDLQVVHRLDMSTSGLLVFAKSLSVHEKLQAQFINRTIKKRYTAILDGEICQTEGVIELPLRLDINDRPRQMVCETYGKPCKTIYKVIEVKDNKTKIHFYPVTGRTHQLRVHSAHSLGLNTPILGDDLYGTKSDRLYLHSDTLELTHPITGERMKFFKQAEFG